MFDVGTAISGFSGEGGLLVIIIHRMLIYMQTIKYAHNRKT